LEVKQRTVLCCFTLLAIINASTMRLCLDFSLNRIVLDCVDAERAAPLIASQTFSNWRMQLQMWLNQVGMNRLTGGQTNGAMGSLGSSGSNVSCSELWSRQTQSIVVMAFYVGYILTNIPGGRLSERYGGKWVLGAAILLSGLLTLITPAAVRCGGPYLLVVIRLMVGLCEGPCFPAVCALLAQWVPEEERGMLASCVLSGGEIGIVVVQMVSGLVAAEKDWPLGFYLVGGGAVLWFCCFALVCYSKPDACPFIQDDEREYIRRQTRNNNLDTSRSQRRCDRAVDAEQPAAPWKSMLTSRPMWALLSVSLQPDWGLQRYPLKLQKVLDNWGTRGGDLWAELGLVITVAGPRMGTWLASLSSGRLSDFLVAHRILSRTQTRRLMSWLVFVCGSMYMLQEDDYGASIWSILSMGAYYAGIKLLPLDMSPNYAATVMGISGALSALPDLLMPYLHNWNVSNALIRSIRVTLWVIGACYISGDEQGFNRPWRRPQ
ncbi:hypothetical protein KR018_005264, partial [Drosophila ironensis]